MDKMEVTINNFGAIKKESTVEIKPLTILIGPNNSGKTWFAYLASAIFGWPGELFYTDMYINGKFIHQCPLLDNLIEDILRDGSASIDLSRFYKLYHKIFMNNMAESSKIWFNLYHMIRLKL